MANINDKTGCKTPVYVNLFLKSQPEISFWVGSYPIFATSLKKPPGTGN